MLFMRLWSIHPEYLDAKGLLGLWREALLAQKVLMGETKGYTEHPQLDRFKNHPLTICAIGSYLKYVYEEGRRRGYGLDKDKIIYTFPVEINVTSGQIIYEFEHLKKKLKTRDQEKYREISRVEVVKPHPLFRVIEGPKEVWEK